MDLYAVFEKRPTVTYVVTEGGTFNDGSTSRTEVDDAGYHIYIRNEWPERDGKMQPAMTYQVNASFLRQAWN